MNVWTVSSSFLRFLPTSLSEQTAKLCSGVSLSCVHSVSVCDSSDRLGTRNSTRLPAPAIFSAIFRLVKVLPVPQAMMSLPRSAVAKPPFTCIQRVDLVRRAVSSLA